MLMTNRKRVGKIEKLVCQGLHGLTLTTTDQGDFDASAMKARTIVSILSAYREHGYLTYRLEDGMAYKCLYITFLTPAGEEVGRGQSGPGIEPYEPWAEDAEGEATLQAVLEGLPTRPAAPYLEASA